MKFKDFQFGFADAEKEFTRIPEIFEKAFWDPKGIIDKLINQYYFLLIGRKGVGKSAFSAKIQSISQTNENLFSYPISLNDFEFSTFAKTNVDSDIIGTQKYKSSWDFIILLIIYKIIYYNLEINTIESIETLVNLLSNLGFPLDLEYKRNVTTLSKLKVGGAIGNFDISFEKEFGIKPTTFLERLSILNEKLRDTLSNIWFNDKKIVILIDGVDDILRFKKSQSDILSSLIRSIDNLNSYFEQNHIPIKVVLFIREDIFSTMTDPDLNKITRDSSIMLNWYNNTEDLKSIINLRFKLSGIKDSDINNLWNTLFPKLIKNKTSWEYILEHTLRKPRDVLQFFKCCQDLYPDHTHLNYRETQNALKSYSSQYFIAEMKNELAGFIEDKLINLLPNVLQTLGTRSFSLIEFKNAIYQIVSEKIDDSKIKKILFLLFECGYVGQIFKDGRNNSPSIIFKHRNANSKIDYSKNFITHKGLYSGLGIRTN